MVVLFLLSVTMFAIGVNHFAEDTYSSKIGLESLQTAYQLNIQIFSWSYWTMSLAPQVASMVFFYMFLSDTSKKWSLVICLGAQVMDFFADSWYRSDGRLFDNTGVFIISGLLTFVYYSIGSEFFVTVGGGLILKLFAPALHTWKVAMENIEKASKGDYRPEPKQQDTKPMREDKQERRSEVRTKQMQNNPKMQHFIQNHQRNHQNHQNNNHKQRAEQMSMDE